MSTTVTLRSGSEIFDDRIDPDVVAAIQAESNKKIEQQEWTVIATIEDVLERPIAAGTAPVPPPVPTRP